MGVRDRFKRAFTAAGSPEPAAVASYDGIFIRDHWHALTDVPWWYAFHGIAEQEVAWASDYAARSGLEWLSVRPCRSRVERDRQSFERRDDGTWLVDQNTGERTLLAEPIPGGKNTASARSAHPHLDRLPATREEVDALIPVEEPFDKDLFLAEGRNDSAVAVARALDIVMYSHVASPVWSLYGLLGYEGMMIFLAEEADLAVYAGRRILTTVAGRIRMAAALGAEAVWIEECLTDQIHPRLFEEVNLPLVTECVRTIRECGMKSIYYYCGNPNDRLELILEAGADAVHFEESKKGFTIDIDEVVLRIDGRCTVFGNLDSVGVLARGSLTVLESEIRRQLAAGRRNGGRFVMSTGSPITPETSVERVKLYTDLVRRIAAE